MTQREEVICRISSICSAVNDDTLEQLERIMLAYIAGAAVKKGVKKKTVQTTQTKEVKQSK